MKIKRGALTFLSAACLFNISACGTKKADKEPTVSVFYTSCPAENPEGRSGNLSTGKSGGLSSETPVKKEYEVESAGKEEVLNADDGTELITVSLYYPKIVNTNNSGAEKRIAEALEEIKKTDDNKMREYFETAKSDYSYYFSEKGKEKNNGEEWLPYSYSKSFETAYSGEKAVSFLMTESVFTGGAHPSDIVSGVTFDTESGERLSLQEMAENPVDFVEFLKDGILKQAAEGVFDDYKTVVENTKNSFIWYINGEDLIIVFNEGDIAPYTEGKQEFHFSLKECSKFFNDYTKSEFGL